MEFTDKTIALSSGPLSYSVAGTGPAVVYIHGTAGARVSDALRELAQSYTVFVPSLAGLKGKARSQVADLVAEFIAKVAADKVDVIGHGSGARIAAWLGARHSGALDALVLVAPEDFARPDVADELEAELPNIACLTLVLAGNADTIVSSDALHLLKRRVARSFLVYVHDAGHDIEADKPRQFVRVVGDFLQWGEGFLVRRNAA